MPKRFDDHPGDLSFDVNGCVAAVLLGLVGLIIVAGFLWEIFR